MNYITERVLMEANDILKTGHTIREVAQIFHVSKSTVHKDMQERLLHIDKRKFREVEEVLNYHTCIRHLRGGESTRKKYLKEKR